jgi:prepilin peptidase CpaA
MNNTMEMTLSQVIALGLAAVACGCDIRTRRIPQLLTLGGAAAGFAFHIAIGGWSGASTSAAGWALGIAIFLAPFALGGLGAGDVKLLGALGAWLGPGDVIWLALYAGIAGGVLALAVSLATGYLSRAVANVRLLITHWIVNGVRPLPDLTLEHGRGPRLAYAVPILAGTVVRLWLR